MKPIKMQMGDENISNVLNQILTKSIALSGIKAETDQLTIGEIMKMFFSIYNHLAPAEIYKAFELERMRLYETKTEHFQLFDTSYASEILKKYIDWKLNLKQKHNITRESVIPIQNQLPEISSSQLKEKMDQAIRRCWDEYLETKTISNPLKHVFEELVKRGFIKYPPTEQTPKLKSWYQDRKEKAKRIVESDLKKQKASNLEDPKLTKSINESLLEIMSGNSSKVEIKLFEIVLKEFFQNRIDKKLPLEDLIK